MGIYGEHCWPALTQWRYNRPIFVDVKKMRRSTLLTVIILVTQLSCTQEKVESRTTLNRYPDGQILREHVEYQSNDTIIEVIYFQNGKLNHKRQLLNDQRTGRSYTYNKKGELLFMENYLDGELAGEFKAFYPSGQVSRIEHYQGNKNMDTTTYYGKDGQVTKRVAFLAPCDLGSCDCDQLVDVYENGSKIYSYEMQNGSASGNPTVYDQAAYLGRLAKDDQVPLYEEGRSIFRSDCGMCHKRDKQLAGVALNSFPKTMNEDELIEIVAGRIGHPAISLSEKQAAALIEYINNNCP